MSNFTEDRRQGYVDFTYEPYRDNWKRKNISSIKYKDYLGWGWGGLGRGGVII